jgi:acyl CoA:acetate/3-ketoacid CoA transferase beta subunit
LNRRATGWVLREIAPGVSVDQVLVASEASLIVAAPPRSMGG